MLKYGLINELGTGENLGFARVEFDELEIKSGWLSLPCSGSKDVKSWVTFPVNTQVAVLMHSDGEQGEIIGSTWSDIDSPPDFANATTRGIMFPDGNKIYYDWNAGKLFVTSAKIEINGGNLGGLIKIDDLVLNIKAREKRINNIVGALSDLATACTATGSTPLTGASMGALITTAISSILTPLTVTAKSDFEDTKITH